MSFLKNNVKKNSFLITRKSARAVPKKEKKETKVSLLVSFLKKINVKR